MAKQKTEKQELAKTPSPQKLKPDSITDKAIQIAPKVVILFAVSFIVHVIVNCLVCQYPKIVIDEGLYTNIARSLAWEGKLEFRGQPINYPYLLYPFLLVPLYWIHGFLGGDIYRYVQVFNTLLIVSSVFPVYCFAKDFTGDKNKALLAGVIVSCMPDMLMGGYEMAEALIWPLALWMIFFCYRFFTTNELRYGLLNALFTGLMFAAKPGAIAAGAVMLLVHAIKTMIKDRSRIRNTLLSILLLLGIVGVVYGIFVLLFGATDSLLGLYTKQTSEWKQQDVLVAVEATFLTAFLFIFACGGVHGVLPLFCLSDYDDGKRHFILSFLLGVCAVIIGTAIFVVPYKWTGELGMIPLHMRYCAMFLPVMFVFSADMDLSPRNIKSFLIALAVFVVLVLFPGGRAGFVKGNSMEINSFALAAFNINGELKTNATGWILTFFVALFSIFLIFYTYDSQKKMKKGKRRKNSSREFRRIVAVYYVLFLLFNSICACLSASIYIDPTIEGDALEVNAVIADRQCLGIMQRRYYNDIYTYWLESRLSKPMQQVTIDQMLVQMDQTGGVYSPFVPVYQAPNVNNHETPETDTFILGMTIADHLELNESVQTEKTANGHFTIARIEPSKRWIDTMLYGLDDNMLEEGVTGQLLILDKNRNIDGNLVISITAYGDGILNIGGKKLQLESSEKTYEVTLKFQKVITMTAENAKVQIVKYTTQKK